MKLLHLDSSILGPHSASRQISRAIVDRLSAIHEDIDVSYHDLDADPRLHLSSKHMAAFQGAPFEDPELGSDIAAGGAYIDELFAHDLLVIGLPMYNFTIPSQLKAWVDRILVAGKTFRYGASGPEGLVSGKRAFIASTRGGVYSAGAPAAPLEHQESYLLAVLGFIGITDVTIVRAEGLAINEDAKQAAIAGALETISALAA